VEIPTLLQDISLGLIAFCAALLVLVNNWRFLLGFLSLQYVGVMALVSVSWPLEIAVVKLIAGWMAVSILMLTYLNLPEAISEELEISFFRQLFHGLVAILIGLVGVSLQPTAIRWFLSASPQQALAGLLLLGLGLLQLGINPQGVRTVVGLLTVLAGFEILYASLEASVLMTGLLAVLNIGIAFVGAYLLVSSQLEVEI
jgi:hypothetical protein